MNPPPHGVVTAVPVPIGAQVEARRAESLLRPALPNAIVVPPLVVTTLAFLLATMTQVFFAGDTTPWALFRPGLAALVACAVTLVVRAIVESLQGAAVGTVVALGSTAMAVALFDLWVPGAELHPATFAAVCTCALIAEPASRFWRSAWESRAPRRVTLLAPSVQVAREALERFRAIPWIEVSSLLLPTTNRRRPDHVQGCSIYTLPDGLSSSESRVVVCSPTKDAAVDQLVARMVASGRSVESESSQFRSAEGRVDTLRVSPLNVLLSRSRTPISDALSRTLNVFVAAFSLLLFAPVMVLVAAAIKLDSRGPVLFRQRRIGFRGREFNVLKFRSMFEDAEARTGPMWASENDPRVTRVGRVLRRTRLDELPQLINVLRGEMSLVGPRPERDHFYNVLRDDIPLFELRTAVRPGISGWAQIRSAYAAATDQARTKLEYDLYYIMRRSPWFDLAILFDTVGVALRGLGAR